MRTVISVCVLAVLCVSVGFVVQVVHADLPTPLQKQKCVSIKAGAQGRGVCTNPNACSQATPPCAGTCKVGPKDFAIIACDHFTEVDYNDCRPEDYSVCQQLPQQLKVCLTFTGHTTTLCMDSPPWACPGSYKVPDCR
jgi:hypothetical protein